MKRVPVLLLLLLHACSAPGPGEWGPPLAPESPAIRVSSSGDVEVLSIGVRQNEHGLQLAGSLRLRWPLLPAHRTARVVARDAEGLVVIDRLIAAELRPATLRHKSGREASFRLELQDPMLPSGFIRTVEVSIPGDSEF